MQSRTCSATCSATRAAISTRATFYGWNRRIALDAPTELAGSVSVLVQGGRIQIPGEEAIQLGPWRTDHAAIDYAGIKQVTRRFVDAFLDVTAANLRVDPSWAEPICGAMTARVSGALAASAARGRADVWGTTKEFQERVLTFNGTFTLDEEAKGEGTNGWVAAHSEGKILALGVDYAPIPARPRDAPLAAGGLLGAAALVAIVVAAKNWGTIVGAFFSHFRPDNVLDDPNRRLLVDVVAESPGLAISKVSQRLGWQLNRTKYHVAVLERTRILKVVRQGKIAFIALAAASAVGRWTKAVDARSFVAQHDSRLAFAVEVLKAGPVASTDLRKALQDRFGLSPRGARHVVNRGMKAGLMSQEGTGGGAKLQCAL